MSKFSFAIRTALASVVWVCITNSSSAQVILSQGFEVISGNLPGPGWFAQNNSTAPLGSNTVIQGLPGIFPAQAGPSDSYAAMNFMATASMSSSAIISVWLVTPMITLENGTQISFYSRTVSSVMFADRMQVRFSADGLSTDVGTQPTDVGVFTNLLLDINPTYSTAAFPVGYPTDWQNYTLTISGLGGPTTGRVAFRYFVENGGPNGTRSEYIGIDTLEITGVPEPTSMALCGSALGFWGCNRWRNRHRSLHNS